LQWLLIPLGRLPVLCRADVRVHVQGHAAADAAGRKAAAADAAGCRSMVV